MAYSVKQLREKATELYLYLLGKGLGNAEIYILATLLQSNALIKKMADPKEK